MRLPFVHEALLVMAEGQDRRAPGAAVTAGLCGHWDHEPPCPIAPHHSDLRESGTELLLRVTFAAEPGQEQAVRRIIDEALRTERLDAPGGEATWGFRHSGPAVPSDEEVLLVTAWAT